MNGAGGSRPRLIYIGEAVLHVFCGQRGDSVVSLVPFLTTKCILIRTDKKGKAAKVT